MKKLIKNEFSKIRELNLSLQQYESLIRAFPALEVIMARPAPMYFGADFFSYLIDKQKVTSGFLKVIRI